MDRCISILDCIVSGEGRVCGSEERKRERERERES